jgi:hypothetical protein
MKASKEYSVDLFIKSCIEMHELTSEREIVDKARETDSRNAHFVKELIINGNSEAYNNIDYNQEDCDYCGSIKMYDSEKQEFYCPMCD